MRVFLLLLVIQGYAAFNLTWAVPAVNLDANPPVGDTDVNVVVAIDSASNACAAWGRTAGHNAVQEIWASLYYHSSRTWTGAMKISGGANSANVQVAVDKHGNALFVWEEGFPSKIMVRTLSSLGVWTPALSSPALAISKTPNAQTAPKLVMNEEGEALVIWTEFLGGSHQLCAAQKIFDETWDSATQISSGANDLSLGTKKTLAMNQNGDALAAWEEAGNIVCASRSNNTWSPSLTVGSGKHPSIAIDPQGAGVIVWEQEGTIFSSKWLQGQLQATQTISDPLYLCERPCVKVEGNGDAVIVFERSNALHKFITGARLSRTSSEWSTPSDISPPSLAIAKEAGFPVLALNGIGDGVVVWKEFDGISMVIQGAGYSLGTWSLPKVLSSVGSHAAERFSDYDIDVALNLSGNIIAVWPEDPEGKGAQHIKATTGVGLANSAPVPPTPHPMTIENGIASGYQVSRRFPAHLDLVNILTWSCDTPAVYYKIYRNNLSSLIGTSTSPYFEDHQRSPKQKDTYLITTVDENEQESSPMTLIVHPK